MLLTMKKILIADSDQETRQMLVTVLRKEGFTPVEAVTAGEAYRHIRSKTDFSGVVFDILMPNLDAAQMLTMIRSESRYATLPVLTIGADAGVSYIQECFTSGTTMFLPKPFTQERLHSALLILLSSHLKKIERPKRSAPRRVFAA